MELGSVVVVCGVCGRRYDLNGKLRVVSPGTDATIDVEHVVDGPCPGCLPPDGGGEELPEVTAAE